MALAGYFGVGGYLDLGSYFATSPHPTTLDDFHHRPLDNATNEIRLLRLRKKTKYDDTIRAQIEHRPVHHCRPYRALSYTWHSDHAVQLIEIDGGKFEVQGNLWLFLKHARDMLYDIPLWIDAICIDQSSTEERSHQVLLMGSIYTGATEVIIWLGECGASVNHLFKLMQQPDSEIRSLRSHHIEHYLRSIHMICHLPYWFRVWIIQELLLANSIRLMSANSLVEWERFWSCTSLLMKLSEKNGVPPSTHHGIFNSFAHKHRYERGLRKKSAQGNTSVRFNNLLQKYSASRCTVVRDRIIGLLSLVEGGNTFQDSYFNSDANFALRACIHFGGNLETLARMQQSLSINSKALYTESLLWRRPVLRSQSAGSEIYNGQVMSFELGHGFSQSTTVSCITCGSKISHILPTTLHQEIEMYCLRAIGAARHMFVACSGLPSDVRTSYRVFFDHDVRSFDRYAVRTFRPVFESFMALQPVSERTTQIYMALDFFVRLVEHLKLPEPLSSSSNVPSTIITTTTTYFQKLESSFSERYVPVPGAWPYLGDALLLAPERDGGVVERCFANQMESATPLTGGEVVLSR